MFPLPDIIQITSLADPALSVYTRLTEAQLRNRQHPDQALFIAEGDKVIGHALDAGCVPVSLLMETSQPEGRGREILRRCPSVPVYTADNSLLEKLTGFRLTKGFLCAMRRPAPSAPENICREAHRIAVLDGIVDPTNVGAIMRSAAALGMDAVLLSPTCCDPLHRRAVRVSMGTVFQVPWAWLGDTASSWPEEGMTRLKAMGFHTAAMALDHRAVSVADERLAAWDKLALLLGTEGDGLSPETIAACDDTVCIPMAHGVDSLNVGAAAAIAFWELRWRG